MNSGEITQEYDQHLGPVNSITWVDENRRFITTSDDKSIRAWDYDIPVVIKYIAEPHMHSMPAVTLHPSSKSTSHSLAHALVIIIYCRKILCRTKSGQPNPHLQRGQLPRRPPSISFDAFYFIFYSRWISSGDGHGDVVFWDYKTGRIKSRLKCHSKVVIAHEWLEHETSKVVTASWDGLIKLWVRLPPSRRRRSPLSDFCFIFSRIEPLP